MCSSPVCKSLTIVFLLLILSFAGAGMAGELSGTATLMANAHKTQVTLNGVVLTPLSGGASQSIRLFNPEHSMRSQAPEKMAYMFSLREGENVIEVTFEKSSEDELDLDLRIAVSGFDKPHFQMTIQSAASGKAKQTFVVGAPGSDFETVMVDDSSLDEH